jgi:arylsulfatase A-like enzyme
LLAGRILRIGFWGAVCAFMACLSLACGGPQAPTPASATSGPAAIATPTPRPGPPDIVLILADDMGWGDLGVYGNPVIRTPNIDGLAAEGSRFEAMYVPTPICAPSRASILTGRYGRRNGVTWNNSSTIQPSEITVAQILKNRGYATAFIGKWHLGAKASEMPLSFGFEYFYGMHSSPPGTSFVMGDQVTSDFPGMTLLTRRLTTEATSFIKRTASDRPLFIEIAHHAPHGPNDVATEFAGRSGWGAYGDAVEELDWSVGEVMRTLRDTGREKNALVFFLSDNGPTGNGSPGPFTYGKGNINEGGVRVPAIAWQPGKIPANRLIKDPASSLDLFPTFAGLAGAPMPAKDYDGVDIVKLLTGQVDRIPGPGVDGGREFIFFGNAIDAAAIRSGKWKYIRPGFRDSVPILYDLENDPGETNTVRRFNLDIANLLEKRLAQLTPR